jgi:subtilisin family serine protease
MKILKPKKILFFLLLLSLIVTAFSFQWQRVERERHRDAHVRSRALRSLNAGQPFRIQGPRYVPGEVLVKFKPTLRNQAIEAAMAAYSTKKIKRIPRLDIYQLQISRHFTVEEVVYAMRQNPDIEYAEPNYIAHIAVVPNDTFFPYQYALQNTGQEVGISGSPRGKAGADIKATAAWDETKGTADDIIAIIDSGVDFDHPEIKNKVVSRGRDYVNNDFDATDDLGHGTFVAGIAAADTNNSQGIAGVAWNAKILPLKVMDKNGQGDYSWLTEALIYAADNGADVINLSLGGSDTSESLRQALKYAHDKGLVIAAAAGNEGSSVLYPAAYDEFCLAVAATDYNDTRMSWSNFGPEVDVAAPGERIVGPVPTWYWASQGDPGSEPYAFGFGTSASTPHVAGLAALIKGLKPWLTADQIMDVIRYTADDVNSAEYKGKDEFIGYGRINMEKALVPIKISK